MSKKLNISLLCGGQSTEHEISILSAKNVLAALDREKYEVSVIYITRQGLWYLLKQADFLNQLTAQQFTQAAYSQQITVVVGDKINKPWMALSEDHTRYACDCVFPVLHGTLGEDGAMQGLLEQLNISYIGSGVLGSAVCMAKHASKSLLRQAKLPTPDWLLLDRSDLSRPVYAQVQKKLGDVLFVKPANLGSSVGISKVRNETEFEMALQEALTYDDYVIVEPAVAGREIEVSVLGNTDPVASLPGEIITHHDFYSYTAKYLDPHGAEVVTPAALPKIIIEQIQDIAVKAYKVLQCSGMARVDFFVDGENILINEINTIPGFTNISMYPKNWEVSGLSYSELLDDLIHLAVLRHEHRETILCELKTVRPQVDDMQLL